MSLLMDAPPGLGVLEALEALPFDDLSVGEAGAVVRAVAMVHGRADVVHAKALGVFARVMGRKPKGRPIRRRGWRMRPRRPVARRSVR